MKLDPQLLEFAKTMRSNATDAENLMWQLLRAKRFMNLKFHPQCVKDSYKFHNLERQNTKPFGCLFHIYF